MFKQIRNACTLAAITILLTACGSTDESSDAEMAQSQKAPGVVSAMAKASGLDINNDTATLASPAQQTKPRKSDGLWLPTKQDHYTVLFDLNSNGLNDAYKGELISFAQFLGRNPDQKIHVDGFTCELGSAEYNVALGQRRAYAVSKFLESKGVRSQQIVLVSYGKERPADPAHNEIAWTKNRRVEVFF